MESQLMLYVSIISLFLLASLTIYFLIKLSYNRGVVFVLTPLLIASSILSYLAFKELQGSPIDGYPTKSFSVLAVHVAKPDMVILVRHTETNEIKSYKIPFSNRNAATMNREKQLTEKGVARNGNFVKNKFGEIRYIVDTKRQAFPPKSASPNQQTSSPVPGGR